MDFRAGTSTNSGFRLASGPQTGVDPYILPVMSGMLSIQRTSIKGNNMTFVLMTRRSRHRTGTRYFSRGIDENGHVSNFNETEQSIILNDVDGSATGGYGMPNGYSAGGGRDVQVLSYVQTRGSVPVYWAEVNKLKYTPELQIRGVDSAIDAAKLHFDEQINTYGDNYLVNLVNQKGREKPVKDAYEQLVRQLQSTQAEGGTTRAPDSVKIIEAPAIRQQFDRIHYVYFDFHNETRGFRWHRTQLLIDELHEALVRGQYFHGIYNTSDRTGGTGRTEVRSVQRAVVRTNCMDCLDRTNVVQSMLGRFSLNRMLQDQGVMRKGESASEDSGFEDMFRNVWADNADIVSKGYSGTGALKTDFTRTGARTKSGALQDFNNSVTRYFRNNFTDGPRQDGFDLLSGAFLPDGASGAGGQFTDRRPVLVQAIPYILLASTFFISIALGSRRVPESTIWPLRFLILAFLGVAAYCANFVVSHGTLYVSCEAPRVMLAVLTTHSLAQVNWPKLNTPVWATEGYQDAMVRATKDPVLGTLVKHFPSESGSGRIGIMEEGKKRKE